MEHKCEHEVDAPLLLTLPTGELFVLSPAEFTATFTQTPYLSLSTEKTANIKMEKDTLVFRSRTMELDGSGESEPISPITDTEAKTPPRRNSRREPSCASCYPAIETLTIEELLARETAFAPPSPEHVPRGLEAHTQSRAEVLLESMVYNEYGELAYAADARRSPEPNELSVTQLLRLINKAYRHEYRGRLREVIVLQLQAAENEFKLPLDNVSQTSKKRLSLWSLRELAEELSPRSTSDGLGPLTYTGPPRILEIGCGDGSWCFKVKEEQPNWIVEGIDDTDHWHCVHKDKQIKDFMVRTKSATTGRKEDDYFRKVPFTQNEPEFSLRDINYLTSHRNPIPHNLYSLIRGCDIFSRVESYKLFLEENRLILHPEGVIELIELDPRPRYKAKAQEELSHQNEHKSGTENSWTDKIGDRFKNPLDAELTDSATHAWAARVESRLKATLRPADGVPAVHLKSWLEGVGYWDVKQNIVALTVGGETKSGKLLKEFLLYQIALENAIPKLLADLPAVNLADLDHGLYFLNLHLVTGRKPKDPRPGDILSDGTRLETTTLKPDRNVLCADRTNSQWQRFDFDGVPPSVASALGGLRSLEGAPDMIEISFVPERAEVAACPRIRMDSLGDGV